MPLDLGHESKGDAKPANKADKRRQQLMVGGTIVLVVIGFLTLKKMGGGGTGSSALPSGGAVSSGGESAGAAAGNQSQLDSLTSQIGILNSKVTDLTAQIPLPGSEHGTGLLPATPPTDSGHGTGLLPHLPIVHNVKPDTPTTKKSPKIGTTPWRHQPPTTGTGTYTVKKGDNLTSIGRKFGESWQTLYKANKKVVGSNPNLILPGQKLVVNKPAVPSKPAAKPLPVKAVHPSTHG